MVIFCLKLTPFIGDGNIKNGSNIVGAVFLKFKTNPVYRGRKPNKLSTIITNFKEFKTNPVYRGRKQNKK